MNQFEFEKQPVEVQDLQEITHHSRGIGWNIPQINERNTERSHHVTRLDLETDEPVEFEK